MSLPFLPLSEYGERAGEIGRGGFGIVYKTSKGYAIKETENPHWGYLTSLEEKQGKEDNSMDYTPGETALHEIVSLLKVDSPYVIPLVDVALLDGKTCLVLPLARGSLQVNRPPVSIKETMRQILEGIIAIHNANLLHLDIKPENILISPEENIWIADLGLSQIHTCAFLSLRGTYYALPYRPPECILDQDVTEKSDIWAIGVLFAEMLISRGGDSELLFNIPGLYPPELLKEYPEEDFLLERMDILLGPNGTMDSYLSSKGLSLDERKFIQRILHLDPKKRPDANKILLDPYLEGKSLPLLTCYDKLLSYTHYPPNAWGKDKMRHRKLLIEWILEITNKVTSKVDFGYSERSISLAIYLVDCMYYLKGPIDIYRMQLYALAALHITTYFYDLININAPQAAHLSSGRFTPEEIELATKEILELTSFDLSPATSYIILSYYFQVDSKALEAYSEVLRIWKLSLLTDYHFRDPALVAEKILILAGVKEGDAHDLAQEMEELL